MILIQKAGTYPPEIQKGKLEEDVSSTSLTEIAKTTVDTDGPVAMAPEEDVISSSASDDNEVSSATDASIADGADQSESSDQTLVTSTKLPASTLSELSVFMGGDGNAYIRIADGNNAHALRIGGKQADHLLLRLAHQAGVHLKRNDRRDINDDLTAHTELYGAMRDVWYRVAQVQDGIELDVGDKDHTRILVTPGKVENVDKGSDTLFYRTTGMRPFAMPADDGDLNLLDKYLNLRPTGIVLLKGWLGYTLAHPKVSTTNFVILAVLGDQGSGKTFLCKIIQDLTDPSIVGVQTFPRNEKDLAIASQHAHVLFYDNMRSIKPLMADKLCIATTGGALTGRELYTNSDQAINWLHVALVLNGIHDFIGQPDLAQRCMPLHLLSIDEKDRLSESELLREFQADLPHIFRGLLDLIAAVMTHLPSVEVTNPERMIDFVRWLAAMEKVDDVPAGIYQMQYSDALKEGMLDSLLENPLAAAVMSFSSDSRKGQWSGTSTELLQELSLLVGNRSRSSLEWPQNPVALSKRLKSLQAGLRRQGIEIEFGRGKHRNITITNTEAF